MDEPVTDKRVKRDAAIAEHPQYKAQVRRLRFARENFDGSGGYAPFVEDITIADRPPDDEQLGTVSLDKSARTHLYRHPREKEKFSRRVMMAYLTNVIKRSLAMLLGFLTKAQPIYDAYPQQVKDWMSEVNAAGDNWQQFKEHEILPPLGYYGWLPVIFYHPPTMAETRAQQDALGGRLTCDVINPENIIDWLWAPDGSFVWFKTKTTVDRTGPMDGKHKEVDRYTWYTQDGWWAVDDDGTSAELPVVDFGAWANGLPVVIWRLRGGAITADANAAQREAYNVNSLIQEQERSTAFAMLKAPDGGSKDRVQAVGSDNVWYFPHDARHTPDWMAPPPHVLEHLMKKHDKLVGEIMENMGLDFDKGGGQTGMAFQFKMSKIVRLLQGLANSMSRGETGSLARVAMEINAPLKSAVRCVWPDEFDAKDVEKLMDGFGVVFDRSKSTTAKIEADVKLCSAGLGDMDEKTRNTIRKEATDGWKAAKDDADNMSDLQDAAADIRDAPDEDSDEDADDIQADGGAR